MRTENRFPVIQTLTLVGMLIVATGGTNLFPLAAATLNTATVTLSPASTTVASGGTVAYYSAVTGSASQTITWFVDGIAKGNATVGILSPNGDGAHVIYKAPATGGTHTIKAVATNASGSSVSGSTTVTVKAAVSLNTATVTLSPAAAAIAGSSTVAYYASVSGSASQTITWFVDGYAKGNATVGTLSPNGDGAHVLYKAPATGGIHTVKAVATNAAGASVSGSATVSVGATTAPTITAVTVSPISFSLTMGTQKQLAAAVTGTGSYSSGHTWAAQRGSVSSTGLYTAPATSGSDIVTVTSVQDPTKKASATVTVAAIASTITAVTASPTSFTLDPGTQRQCTATVTGTGSYNSGITWSAQRGSVSSTGVYTAPSTGGSDTVTARSVQDAAKAATLSVTVSAPSPAPAPGLGPLAAFPGAEGVGAGATGGRGGDVYTVNTLDDVSHSNVTPQNGPMGAPCSLRDAMQKSGTRTIVFSVGGTITLNSPIYPAPGNLTIAGQTAPGGGIQIRGNGSFGNGGAMIHLTGNNVIVRYLRLRPGLAPLNSSYQGLSSISGSQAVSDNQIIDHCSFEWDGNKAISWGGLATRATLSWNLIAEGMAPHSTGPLMNGGSADQATLDQTSFDGHHNIMATLDHRLPYTNTKYVRWINNLVFGYSYAALARGNTHFDLIGNVFDGITAGISANSAKQELRWADTVAHNENQTVPGGDKAQFFMSNNFGPHNPSGTLDNYSTMLRLASSENSQLDNNPVDPQFKATGPTSRPAALSARPISISHLNTHTDLKAILTPTAGAYRRLAADGSWVINRDPADAKMISYIMNPSTSPTSLVTYPGTMPTLAAGTPATDGDGDGDGMPDTWEDAHGLNKIIASDRNTMRANAGGFTNLELYLSGIYPNGTPLP